MAPEAPDPQSLKSWHDAFEYPIPTVRRVEQELCRYIESNKEKLRALVGTRYRELVGAAETIVAMNTEMQEVEALLADVGRRCNPRLIERKHIHTRHIKSNSVGNDAEKHAFGAQLALLHRCTTSIARLLRKRASLLLVAKILAVSRLLHKTLSQHQFSPPFLDDLRNQLASLRRALLKRIDKRLSSINATEDSTIESLAAYCLATSSSSDDAIHKFHQVRLDVITSQLDLSRENIPRALRLFIRTLQTSKTLRSRQLSDVLSELKSRAILSDPEIRSLDGLEIEVLGRWAAPEVNNFTPWIKLSELSRTEGVDSIKQWSKQAFEKFCEACQKALSHSNDFSEILSLRAETLELWLSSWGSTITHSSEDILQRLRNIFNDNLKRVLVTQVKAISEISNLISSMILDWDTAEHCSIGSLWDSDLISAGYSNGALSFKQTVTDCLLGRNDDVSIVLRKYQYWLASIKETKESIDSLRSLKWTDVLVGSEAEDEDIDIVSILNNDDPSILSKAIHASIRQAFDSLQGSFSAASKVCRTSHSSQKATFLLRLIRLIRRQIPAGFVAKDFLFSNDVVPELQILLAVETTAKTGPLSLVPSKAHDGQNKLKIVPGRSLWEGTPALPVQPSPGAFKYLRQLTSTMDESGLDLWDPSTLRILKEELRKQIDTIVGSTLDKVEKWSSSNDATDATPENDLRDWKIQLFFDAVYLSNMLVDSTKLASVVNRVQKSADASTEAVKSIQKDAAEYWKRTELLFGLLAER
ncbi:hypothetical protein N7495_007713 [Penicillium taxi]|uniref:uncharacterized protein n=1 Tax=Penicillium taxi TaxID=168475 RepID=UPI0025457829|nr:uncharacterized protein N7495_007713 [Penicillium taxi]KAJ5887672.1 hypothetical protein N7495_007713 [Penicillium taxi]